MPAFVITTGKALLIARGGSRWSVEEHLEDQSPECAAIDPYHPARVYVGTAGNGVWRSHDGGRSWDRAGSGIPPSGITAIAVGPLVDGEPGAVYAGTEPSTVYRSDDGGDTWVELSEFTQLPSSSSWSFPPRPETHHVRWIEADRAVAGRVYVAVEAGALVRTLDGGRTWIDRVSGGPIDTHSAATHPLAADRLYSAAGDGYFETEDAGESWSRPMSGLRHRYLVGVGVDPADPESVVVSAASGPYVAYSPRNAQAYVYRKVNGSFELAMEGLPAGDGTTASWFATLPDQPGVLYAVNNHGLFRTEDVGQSWSEVGIPWSERAFSRGVRALNLMEE